MTAYALYGLLEARGADLEVPYAALQNGTTALARQLVETPAMAPELRSYAAYVLTRAAAVGVEPDRVGPGGEGSERKPEGGQGEARHRRPLQGAAPAWLRERRPCSLGRVRPPRNAPTTGPGSTEGRTPAGRHSRGRRPARRPAPQVGGARAARTQRLKSTVG